MILIFKRIFCSFAEIFYDEGSVLFFFLVEVSYIVRGRGGVTGFRYGGVFSFFSYIYSI